MQLGRFAPCGLFALHHNSRLLVSASRGGAPRSLWTCMAAVQKEAPHAEQPEEDPRAPPSRRTLFTASEASLPPAANGAPSVSKQELVDVHRRALADAGVELSAYGLHRNRLQSEKASLRQGSRGAARAVLSRQVRQAERLYHSERRKRSERDEKDEGELHGRGSRGREAGELTERDRDRDGGRGRRRDHDHDTDQERDLNRKRGREWGREGGRGREGERPAGSSATEQRREAAASWREEERQGEREQRGGDDDEEEDEEWDWDSIRAGGPKRPAAPKAKPPVPQEVRDRMNRERAARMASAQVAAFEARKAASGPAVEKRGTREEEEEEESGDEGETEEVYSLEDQLNSLRRNKDAAGRSRSESPRNRKFGFVRPASDLIPDNGPNGPQLTHNLPPELNMRLLEAVMAGSETSPIPELDMGASGITQGLLATVMATWRKHELVKLRIRDRRKTAKKYLPYMGQVCVVLESLTGGVVVWRSGRSIWLYRGENFTPERQVVFEKNLNQRQVSVQKPLLSATAPLTGSIVQLPENIAGYLTREAPAAPGRKKATAQPAAAAPGGDATTAAPALAPAPVGSGASMSASPSPPSGGVAVLFLHDAFGIGSPETQEFSKRACDRLAAMLGPDVPVLMPELLQGGAAWAGGVWPPSKPLHERRKGWIGQENGGSYTAVGRTASKLDAAVSYLRGPKVGATKLVLVGTGWGAWIAVQALAADARAAARRAGIATEFETRINVKRPKDGEEVDMAAEEKAAREKAAGEKAEREARIAASSGPLAAGGFMASGSAMKLLRKAQMAAAEGRALGPEAGLTFCAGGIASANHFFEDEERMCRDISVPLLFVSSKSDPMEKFQLHMSPPLVELCAFKRFGQLDPGFLGKQALWDQEEQAMKATQALTVLASFIRWRTMGDQRAASLVRMNCMMGKSGMGQKQTTNLGFPWLEQVTLVKGREAHLKKLKQMAKAEAAKERQPRPRPEQRARTSRPSSTAAQPGGRSRPKEPTAAPRPGAGASAAAAAAAAATTELPP